MSHFHGVDHGVEECRVAFKRETKLVIIAWVQADLAKLPKEFPTNTPEGEFAKNVIWPKFEQHVANSNGT